jgi:hypothetical protein
MAVVYQHRRKDTNDIFYIGIGTSTKRAYETIKRNKHWYNVVNKVGYEVDVLLEGLSWEEASIVEIGMIASYGRKDMGLGYLVNETDGGDGSLGRIESEETRRKKSECHKGEKSYLFGKLGELNTLSKKVKQINPKTGTGIKEYSGASEAGRQLGISKSNIIKCCSGYEGRKTAGGYKWEYVK